eukprot:gnl/TRDRNA2_/TRDRNA2_88017_c0_seq1.p1 gnl/TRDRNA2_/TRDRNA2_88017_c0~~gnl/TRDRNA2_/TRDRNA2_88017_c0_seq1.p1  ORF type:complete len:142 (+),score=10.70 gnl/TRDRNA2_/TRDRNA2_88017_c0_seq1:26-427(+)
MCPTEVSSSALNRLVQLSHDDILHSILSFGTDAELTRWRSISQYFFRVASSSAVWEPRCERLWRDKLIPRKARELLRSGEALVAYRFSLEDAKRTWITVEELCSFSWSHRMKGWSGEEWTARFLTGRNSSHHL